MFQTKPLLNCSPVNLKLRGASDSLRSKCFWLFALAPVLVRPKDISLRSRVETVAQSDKSLSFALPLFLMDESLVIVSLV